MKHTHRLQIEPTRSGQRVSFVPINLSADFTGRLIDPAGRYHDAKSWLENYETSNGEFPELERQLLQSLGPAEAHTFAEPLFRGRFSLNLSEFVVGRSWSVGRGVRRNAAPLFSRNWLENGEETCSSIASVDALKLL